MAFAWSVIYGCAGALEFSSIWYHGVDMFLSTSILPKQPEFSAIFGASHCEKVISYYIDHLPFGDFFEFAAAPFLWNFVKLYHSCLLLQAAGAKKAYSIWITFCVKHFGQSETQMSSIAAINRTNM